MNTIAAEAGSAIHVDSDEVTANAYTLEHQYFRNVISFVIANAWKAEIMAVENYSDMVPLFETVTEKIEAIRQAKDEAKHVLVLEKLARKNGFDSVDESMASDDWINVRDIFQEAVAKKDLVSCLIIQDLMIESLAVGIYATIAESDSLDASFRKVSSQLLDDEIEHLQIGIDRLNALIEQDAEMVNDSLIWANSRIMPLLFGMVRDACDFLCTRKDTPCEPEKAFIENGVLHLDGERTNASFLDLDQLKIASVANYIEMLNKVNFDKGLVRSLIAGLASYENS